jgi:hypothetical protein
MAVNPTNPAAALQITGAIQQAARSSGISFEYLLTTAQIESNLNPGAQASTSSAKGLYQFIDQTWLGTLKTSGAANGYGSYADAITRNPDGRYEVADPTMRAAIMQLRGDPSASAIMAGAFTRTNAFQLQLATGREPTEGELYIAHFLGSDGAGKLINAASAQPGASAADMFPQAAAANRSIFYDSAGHARGVSEVYAKLTGRFDMARATNVTPGSAANINTAALQEPPIDTSRLLPIGSAAAVQPRVARVMPRDTAGVTQAFAQASQQVSQNAAALADSRPLFQSMFTDRARKAVTQTVSSLWAPAAKTAPASPDAATPLDLFTDIKPGSRRLLGGDMS